MAQLEQHWQMLELIDIYLKKGYNLLIAEAYVKPYLNQKGSELMVCVLINPVENLTFRPMPWMFINEPC
jgi:hypothetical protein